MRSSNDDGRGRTRRREVGFVVAASQRSFSLLVSLLVVLSVLMLVVGLQLYSKCINAGGMPNGSEAAFKEEELLRALLDRDGARNASISSRASSTGVATATDHVLTASGPAPIPTPIHANNPPDNTSKRQRPIRQIKGPALGGRMKLNRRHFGRILSTADESTTKPRHVLTTDAEERADEIIFSTPRGRTFHRKSFDSVASHCSQLNPDVFWDCPAVRNSDGNTSQEEWIAQHQPCSDHAFIARIDNGMISDNQVHNDVPGTVFTDDVVYKWQPYVRENLPRGHPIYWRYGKQNATLHSEYECLGSILQAYPERRGHFPHEGLPRLLFLVEHMPQHCPILMLSKEPFVQRFVTELPKEIQDRLVHWEGRGHIYSAGSVYVANEGPYCLEVNPHINGMSTYFQPHVVQLVRKYYSVQYANAKEENRHIVVIKRDRKKGDRYYSQHDELVDLLRQKLPGDQVVEFTGEGTLAEHIKLFASASYVVGPHGAGFANSVFSKTKTKVVEIGWDGNDIMEMDNMYYRISDALDLDYRLVMGRGNYSSPISLDPAVVLKAVLD